MTEEYAYGWVTFMFFQGHWQVMWWATRPDNMRSYRVSLRVPEVEQGEYTTADYVPEHEEKSDGD